MTEERLVGAWSLRRFVVTVDDGRPPLYPLGASARGLVVYEPSGWMSAVLSRGDRAGGGDTLEEADQATRSDKAAAFDSYLSYAGRWRLGEGEVHHEVQLALVPGMVGQTLTRKASLDDEGILTLAYTRRTRGGHLATYTLHWSRP